MNGVAARWALAALLAVSVSQAGCTKVIMQGVHEVRGASAKLHLISAVDENEFAGYGGIRFEPLETSIGSRLCPPTLHDEYDAAAAVWQRKLAEHYSGGGPELTIESEALYYQKKGLLKSALMLSRVRMRAKETLVMDGIVLAKSKSYRAGGESALAAATLKAIGKFLERQKGVESEDED